MPVRTEDTAGRPVPQIIQVALDDAAFGYDRLYSYIACADWFGKIAVGMRVAVPFGRQPCA